MGPETREVTGERACTDESVQDSDDGANSIVNLANATAVAAYQAMAQINPAWF